MSVFRKISNRLVFALRLVDVGFTRIVFEDETRNAGDDFGAPFTWMTCSMYWSDN